MTEIFLIEENILDPMENQSSNAVYTVPRGWVHTEQEAEHIVIKGAVYTRKDCWAIRDPIKQFNYRRLVKMKKENALPDSGESV